MSIGFCAVRMFPAGMNNLPAAAAAGRTARGIYFFSTLSKNANSRSSFSGVA